MGGQRQLTTWEATPSLVRGWWLVANPPFVTDLSFAPGGTTARRLALENHAVQWRRCRI